MRIRPAAPDDALDILDWRNDAEARAMSSSSGVIAREAHLDWYARTLADPRLVMLIGEDDLGKAGMVRFDRGDEGWTVSIAITPRRKGQGLGTALLAAALEQMWGRLPATFIARIRADNEKSLRLFASAGFREISRDGGFVVTRREG